PARWGAVFCLAHRDIRLSTGPCQAKYDLCISSVPVVQTFAISVNRNVRMAKGPVMPHGVNAAVGMPVIVDMGGFRRYGISLGEGTSARGTIVAVGPAGITIKLDDVLAGLDTVTKEPARVTAA